jgi:hypothetical protein
MAAPGGRRGSGRLERRPDVVAALVAHGRLSAPAMPEYGDAGPSGPRPLQLAAVPLRTVTDTPCGGAEHGPGGPRRLPCDRFVIPREEQQR